MKEGQPQPQPQMAPRLSEQRSIEGWENLRCLGRRFDRAEQVAVINARLEEIHQDHDNDDDVLP